MTMRLLLCALALSLAIEGICLALFPAVTRQCFLEAASLPDSGLRRMGVLALVTAIILALVARLLNLAPF